jgi:hypothetical protein
MPVNTENTLMIKKVGRPPQARKGRPIQMRLEDDFLAKVDDWRRIQPDLPNRTEAIRRLVETHPEIRKPGKK